MEQRRVDLTAHDLRLTHIVTELGSPQWRRVRSNDDLVRLHFGLQGAYSVRYPELERSFDLLGGHGNLLYMTPFEFEFENQTPELETFGVAFPVAQLISYVDGASDRLSRFCEAITTHKRGILFEHWPAITPRMAGVIREILACEYSSGLKELYLLSKSLELLVGCVEAGQNQVESGVPLSSGERERLIAARDFVNLRLTDPPTLSEVARSVGLNEYKLKRGFRQLFGSSVFAYLSEQRLELAKRRLLDSDRDVAEIAFELGYATPQHFGSAFKRRFGVTPNSIRKNPGYAIRSAPKRERES